jgi:hypothetical protein
MIKMIAKAGIIVDPNIKKKQILQKYEKYYK